MANSPIPQTSSSLLARLRQDATDQAAWSEFVRRYGGPIYRWCRRWHLQEADAQDVTQTVLLKLSEKMRTFTYDPAKSFRGYLKTLAHFAWCDFLAQRKQAGVVSGNAGSLRALEAVEARDDLVEGLKEQFDQEMLEEARVRVQQRVEPHTWEAFCLTTVERLSGADVAARLGVKVTTIFKAKSKVQKMLQQEVARLEED
jgi:RNA polymerase sigma-70 factor (ECF subfamily)